MRQCEARSEYAIAEEMREMLRVEQEHQIALATALNTPVPMLSAKEPRKEIDQRIARLVAAIEAGGEATSLVAKLRELDARKQAARIEAANLRPVPRLKPAVIENRLAEWRRLLRQSTTQGRAVLQPVLRGRLTFTPRVTPLSGEIDGYDFKGQTRFDKLFTGIAFAATARPDWIPKSDTTGTEGIGPEETFDGDYGRLLERACHGKGVASQDPPSWNQIVTFLRQMRELQETAGLTV